MKHAEHILLLMRFKPFDNQATLYLQTHTILKITFDNQTNLKIKDIRLTAPDH